jgi:hypothetical protein
MRKSSVGACAAGLFVVLCSCLAMGCDDHDRYYGYGHGPGYGPESWSGVLRLKWSLPGSPDAEGSDEDAGAIDIDGGLEADAGATSGASQHACEALGASEFQMLLLDQGSIVAAVQQRCSAGEDGFRLRANDYTATAALVNEDGVPVTETEAIPSFVLAPGETQVIHIAFKKLASAE